MKQATLADGSTIYCLSRPEALALDGHIAGYFQHGIDARPGDIVVDVGANIGLFAMRVLQRTQGQARVFGFEPVPPIFSVLKKNTAQFSSAFEGINEAVGAAEGLLSLTYFPRSPSLSTAHVNVWQTSPGGLASAVEGSMEKPPPGYEAIARLMPAWSKSLVARYLTGKKESFSCPMTTLSAFMARRGLPKIDLLKIDVEGAEHHVFEGIHEADWPRIGAVVAEVHDVEGRLSAVQSLLRRHGLTKQTVEIEPGFQRTHLRNLYATRARA